MENLAPEFNTNRMVEEYARRFYMPASARWKEFHEGADDKAAGLASWKGRVGKEWKDVHLVNIESEKFAELAVGQSLSVRADVYLGELTPDDVTVEAYHGVVDAQGEIVDGHAVPMRHVGGDSDVYRYDVEVPAEGTGKHGFALRIMPSHEDQVNPHDMGLIVWSS